MPFLFWQATWFGRPLSDAQVETNLADREHPRKAQHALSQIADRIASRDPTVRAAVRRWYPQVVALSSSGVDELRVTAAWVMGQDNTVMEFHQALVRLLADPNPMVQRNAALSLVRFGDVSGRQLIRSMLESYPVTAPHAGTLSQRLKPGDVVNPGTLLGHIQDVNQNIEIRTQVPGTLDRWLAANGTSVTQSQPVATLAPSPEMVWESLRGLYLIGQPADLPAIERYTRGFPSMPDAVRQQARNTAAAIRTREAENAR
jgi:biotin carboxyl carrier protein